MEETIKSKEYLSIEDIQKMNFEELVLVNRTIIFAKNREYESKNINNTPEFHILKEAIARLNLKDEQRKAAFWGIEMRAEDILLLFRDISLSPDAFKDASFAKIADKRNELMRLDKIIKGYHTALNAIQPERSQIQKELCELDDHSWTPYLESEEYAHTLVYHRYCMGCEKTEDYTEFNLPDDVDFKTKIFPKYKWLHLPLEEKEDMVNKLKLQRS